jgi:hypothetical protein
MRQLLVTDNVVPSSPILVTLMMEALHSSKNVGFYKSHMLHVLWSLVTANVVPSWPTLVALMVKVMRSSETSVLTRATWG